MEGEGDSGLYTQAVGLIKSLRSTVKSVRVSTPVGVKCQHLLSAATFRKFFSARTFMPLPSFILSPDVEVAILTLYKEEHGEHEDVFTIVRKWKAKLWKIK